MGSSSSPTTRMVLVPSSTSQVQSLTSSIKSSSYATSDKTVGTSKACCCAAFPLLCACEWSPGGARRGRQDEGAGCSLKNIIPLEPTDNPARLLRLETRFSSLSAWISSKDEKSYCRRLRRLGVASHRTTPSVHSSKRTPNSQLFSIKKLKGSRKRFSSLDY